LPAHCPVQLLVAAPSQIELELGESRDVRYRHEHVASVITNEALDVALLVVARHGAESVNEEEVALET
jgi:hypothetical protein